MPLLAYF